MENVTYIVFFMGVNHSSTGNNIKFNDKKYQRLISTTLPEVISFRYLKYKIIVYTDIERV